MWTRARTGLWGCTLALIIAAAAACDDEDGAAGGSATQADTGGEDGGEDVAEDAGGDAPAPNNNLGEDVGEDVPADVAADIGEDAGGDAAEDAAMDAEEDAAMDAEEDTPSDLCALGTPGAADRDRVVLIGHTFTEEPTVDGTEVRTMTLTRNGDLLDDGMRVDIGTPAARAAFVPSGDIALVIGEDYALVSLRVRGVNDVEVIDRVTLPSADFGDLVIQSDGKVAYVVGTNPTAEGGISTVRIGCGGAEDGQLTVVTDAFANILLSDSMALLPGEERALVLGGQALFDPINETRDIRLLRVEPNAGGFTELGAFDVFEDFVVADRIAVSPDGRVALIPNNSPFSIDGGQLAVLNINGDTVEEVDRIMDLPDVTEALFAPDGETALVTQIEPGRVRVLVREGDTMVLQPTEIVAGLASHMALVARGVAGGTVLVPAISGADGPQVVVLRITSKGTVEVIDRVLLGESSANIPGTVAVQP